MPSIVNKNDKVLVEESPERFDVIDAREVARYERPKIRPIPKPGDMPITEAFRIITDDVIELLESHQRNQEKHDYIMSLLEDPTQNLSYIIAQGKGVIKPIDASAQIKNKQLYYFVQNGVLGSADYHLSRNASLHPFEEWMIADDLKLAARGSAPKTLESAVKQYISSMPKYEDLNNQRQSEIVNNIRHEAENLEYGQKFILIIGSDHIERKEINLLDALKRARIKYAAFVPDEEDSVLKHRIQSKQTGSNAGLGMKYLEEELFDFYLQERVKEGAPHYSGNFKGMAERMRAYVSAASK